MADTFDFAASFARTLAEFENLDSASKADYERARGYADKEPD